MRARTLASAIALILLALAPAPRFSQAQEAETCPQFVARALSELGTNCANLGPNSACYGFDQVQATSTRPVAADFFTNPGDRAELITLETIKTSALNLAESLGGIAVMDVQANVPSALPDRAVVFLMLGDVRVENGVWPKDALVSVDPITVNTLAQATLRSAASLSADVAGTVPSDTPLQADGISPDGDWLRVLYESAPAWVNREALDPEVDVSSLPVIDPESLTPMQAFYFNNGFEAPECTEAPPSLLLVQGPREMPIDITANGADIRASSTFILRVLPPGDIMQLIVLDGLVILYPDTPNEILLLPGFAATVCLSEERDLGIDGRENDREVTADCVWSAPRMLTREELAALAPLEDIPENVMTHPVYVPLIITASGVGGPIDLFVFDTPEALTAAREACLEGRLPAEICEHLGL